MVLVVQKTRDANYKNNDFNSLNRIGTSKIVLGQTIIILEPWIKVEPVKNTASWKVIKVK